jgi:hypothetical protein
MSVGNEYGLHFALDYYDSLASHWQVVLELHELLHFRYPNHGRMSNLMLETHLQKAMAQVDER